MQNNKIKDIKNGGFQINSFYLFSFLEVFSIWENSANTYYKILKMPFLRIKKSYNKKEYKLFSLLPIFKIKNKTSNPYKPLNNHYSKVLKNLKAKAQSGQKIRVGFYIVEVFQYASIYEEMLKSDFFEPFIVIVPDVARKEISLSCMNSSYELLKRKYENVYKGFDEKTNRYIDFSDKLDVVFFGNPYQTMAHPYHFIWQMLKRNVLTCYQNYGYNTVLWGRNHICSLPFYNSCWKVFADSQESFDDLLAYQPRQAQNAWISGYCKMDKLAEVKSVEHTRKQILLCPHHTINFEHLQLSNFLKYADFFLELPKKYPEVDFIFRPHQLLRYNLAKYWSEEQAQEYYDKMLSYPNVKYDTGQDYFQTFVNSDAMIHDCGSFTAEYLFTGKPCCYMLKNEEEIAQTFLPIGQKCLNNYYKAFNQEQICSFIENVIVKGEDPLKRQREIFSEYLKLNYPNVGHKITEYIKQEILNAK